jgi:serine/threonine-protein kinase
VAAVIGFSPARVAVTVFLSGRLGTAPTPVVRVHQADLPDGVRFTTRPGRHFLALSPDGRWLAFAANGQLYLRRLAQLESAPILGTQGSGDVASNSGVETNPFFSPDSQWIGFWQDGKLKKASTAGGQPLTICDAAIPWGASWSEDNTILYGQGPAGIWRVSADGGTPEQIIKAENEMAHGPQALPGGYVLFTLSQSGNWSDAHIVVERLADRQRTTLLQGADARFLPTGHVIFYRSTDLFAAPVDLSSMSLTGPASRVAENVGMSSSPFVPMEAAYFTVSSDGLLAYVPNHEATRRQLVWVDRRGRETPVSAPARDYQEVRLSPDGTKAALSDASRFGLLVWDFERGHLTELTTGADATDLLPVWTPDGQTILFGRARGMGGRALYRISADGAGAPQLVFDPGTAPAVRPDERGVRNLGPSQVTRDGSATVGDNRVGDLYVVRLRDDPAVTPLLVDPRAFESNPSLSPDDSSIAYQSTEAGGDHVFLRPFPEVNKGRLQLSSTRGSEPVWSRTGHEIFYRESSTDNLAWMMAVPVEKVGSTFKPGPPIKLFPWKYLGGRHAYDVTADGQRFLAIKTEATTDRDRIILVENWLEQVKRVAPSR